jgi:hypothetical protein
MHGPTCIFWTNLTPFSWALQLLLRRRPRAQLPGGAAPAEVWLHRGLHPVPAGGLRLEPQDSAVAYRAAEPGSAVVSGGHRLGGWGRNGSTPLWRAPLPPANRTRQLYAFGSRARRAATAWRAEWTALLEGLTPRGFLFRPGLPLAGWPDVGQLELVWTGTTSKWTESRCGVAAVARLGNGSVELAMLAVGEAVIRRKSPLNALKYAYDYSCY